MWIRRSIGNESQRPHHQISVTVLQTKIHGQWLGNLFNEHLGLSSIFSVRHQFIDELSHVCLESDYFVSHDNYPLAPL